MSGIGIGLKYNGGFNASSMWGNDGEDVEYVNPRRFGGETTIYAREGTDSSRPQTEVVQIVDNDHVIALVVYWADGEPPPDVDLAIAAFGKVLDALNAQD